MTPALLAATTLAVYLRTLAYDVLPGDAGEFQFAAWRLGLTHPTGYPLYMIVGGLWQRGLALLGANPARSPQRAQARSSPSSPSSPSARSCVSLLRPA